MLKLKIYWVHFSISVVMVLTITMFPESNMFERLVKIQFICYLCGRYTNLVESFLSPFRPRILKCLRLAGFLFFLFSACGGSMRLFRFWTV